MTKYVLLTPQKHEKTKILPHRNFKHSAKRHFSPISVNEFAPASTSFPVVYMKDMEQGKFRAVCMLGLFPESNLFFTEHEWLATHVPSAFLRAPFELGPDPKEEKTLTLYIDEESDYISETDGELLFNKSEPSQFLLSIQQNISAYYQSEMMTHRFTELLLKHDLLVEVELVTQFDDNEQNKIKGLYTIKESSLNSLSQEVLFEFHQQNFLMPIYAMLASITQVNRLMTLHNKLDGRKITGIKMQMIKEDEL